MGGDRIGRGLEALLLKSAYSLAEELSELRGGPGLPALALKAAVEVVIFVSLLYTVSEVAVCLWRFSERLTVFPP